MEIFRFFDLPWYHSVPRRSHAGSLRLPKSEEERGVRDIEDVFLKKERRKFFHVTLSMTR